MNFHHQGQNAVGQVDQGNEPGKQGGKKHQTDPDEGFGAYLPWVDPMLLRRGTEDSGWFGAGDTARAGSAGRRLRTGTL